MSSTATPTKLRNGTWGARVQGDVSEGDTITITARSGKSWQATVEKVVWAADGISICATASLDRRPPVGPSRRAAVAAGDSWWLEQLERERPMSGLVAAVGAPAARRSVRAARRGNRGECTCGACDDLLSIGYRPGQRIRCEECGGWAVAC